MNLKYLVVIRRKQTCSTHMHFALHVRVHVHDTNKREISRVERKKKSIELTVHMIITTQNQHRFIHLLSR